MDGPYAHELTVAITAIQAAVRISQRVLVARDKGVVEKDDHTPVTVADLAIQALLTSSIHASFPDDNFVGEESSLPMRASPPLLESVWALVQDAGLEDAVAPSSREEMCDMLDWCGSGEPRPGRYWVFDPIDGTKAFIRGHNYAVNVCLMEGGSQAVSVVAVPLLSPTHTGAVNNDTTGGEGSIMFATRGGGVFVRPLTGSPGDGLAHRLPRRTAPSPSPSTPLKLVSCVEGTDSAVPGLNAKIAAHIGATYPGNDLLAWVLRWAVCALGSADTTVWVYRSRERRAKIWDHAGAMLLFEEAGGRVTDVHGKPIDLMAGRTLTANFGFVAALEGAHERVLGVVQDTIRAEGLEELLR